MAGPNVEQLDAVFQMIGILDAHTHTTIIEQEGFLSLEDLATLVTNKDVNEMAKHMATRTQAGGRVDLRTIVIQNLKTLVLSGGLMIRPNAVLLLLQPTFLWRC